jgi:hypothetical protein
MLRRSQGHTPRTRWSLGLRPRSSHLHLAGVALLLLAVLERGSAWSFDPHARANLLAEVSAGAWPSSAAWIGGGGLLALCLALITAVVLVGPQARVAASVRAGERASSPARLAASVLAGVVALALLGTGLLAAAARSVDASDASLLAIWATWLGRGLLAVIGAATLVGLGEWWIAARRLRAALERDRAARPRR